MAIYHCSIKTGSRAKGQSAVAASAYRSGEKLTDKETGIVSDYTRKSGVVFSEISLCENAPEEYKDRSTLWNAVHEIEKANNARLWREFEVALPQELDRETQKKIVRDFVKTLTEQGMCVDWSLHDKNDGNPHAHIMATTRSILPSGKWAPKSRKVYDLDENGEKIFQKVDKSGRKQYKSHKEDYNDWNATERVEEWRAAWADCCNKHLVENEKIDHRSYERQGIDQIPTVHEGYAARQLTAAGLSSERVNLNEDIRQRNSLLRTIAEQLKTIGEEIKQLTEQAKEKGSAISGRIADLLARRRRAIDSDDRETTDGERETTGRIKNAAPTEAAETEREPSGTDTETLIRAARAEIRDTRTAEAHSGAERADREAERQRQAVEARRRAEEAERKAREASERARQSRGRSR